MRFAALATWRLAALVGIYLLRTWIANGGLRTAEGEVLGHGVFAVTTVVLVLLTALHVTS